MAGTSKVLDGLILGVDLDGVCADFYARMREIAAEWFERPLHELTPDVSYNLPEWGIKTQDEYNSLHRFAVTQRDLFKTAPMIPRCPALPALALQRRRENPDHHQPPADPVLPQHGGDADHRLARCERHPVLGSLLHEGQGAGRRGHLRGRHPSKPGESPRQVPVRHLLHEQHKPDA